MEILKKKWIWAGVLVCGLCITCVTVLLNRYRNLLPRNPVAKEIAASSAPEHIKNLALQNDVVFGSFPFIFSENNKTKHFSVSFLQKRQRNYCKDDKCLTLVFKRLDQKVTYLFTTMAPKKAAISSCLMLNFVPDKPYCFFEGNDVCFLMKEIVPTLEKEGRRNKSLVQGQARKSAVAGGQAEAQE